MSRDQIYIDFLFQQIYLQACRYNQFNKTKQQTNSVWNRAKEEKEVLDDLTEKYKQYYIDSANKLKQKVIEMKDVKITSYFVYDIEYHIKYYNDIISKIENHITRITVKIYKDVFTELFSIQNLPDEIKQEVCIPTLFTYLK